MIKKNVKQFTFLITALVLVFAWVLKQLGGAEHTLHLNNESTHQSITLSRVSLLLNNTDISSRQGLSDFLQQIDNIAEVISWQLIDGNNQVLSEKQSRQNGNTFEHNLYFKSAGEKLLTLKLNINQVRENAAMLSFTELIAALVLIGIISVLGFYRFKWLYDIEKYSQYLLTNSEQVRETELRRQSNPISQSINQLILNNSKLMKERLELIEQIRKISYVDEVTELGNQLFFKAEFEVRLHNHDEAESGLLMILSFVEFDYDDELVLTERKLKNIANFLRNFIHDIPNALVARLKDNDFVLLLPNQTRTNTDKLCKTIIEQLDKAVFDRTQIKEHFIDIGISAYKQGFDYYKVLSEADMALRNSQLQGGNNWFMFGEALAADKVRGHLRWRSFLQRVLDKRNIQLFGQPIHYYSEREFFHQEIFVRIEDGKELLTADTFLPMANQCGLAAEFDRQVVDGVIKHCLYREQNKQQKVFSINLFISSLMDERFVGWLVGKLSSYPELCQQFIFEIKEAHINQNLSTLRLVMRQLAELGVKWCVEKFGSPEENLGYLELLPIAMVKVDRRIINNIHQDRDQQLLLKALVISLKSKKIDIFVEGVEKEDDANYLSELEICGAQGYFYCEPKRLKRIEKYLKVV
ncbi:EAL domain-containing protein [Aliikangiella coralliicola]|nr:EAL domain-containing protein [Aliikangiella coralliicola]